MAQVGGAGDALELGARIHKAMWKAHISQKTMAAVIGVNQSTLSKKLRGHVSVTVPEFLAISAALGIEPSVLLAGLSPARATVAVGVR